METMAVVFAWGTSEDRQLGLDTEQPVLTPKVVESLLGVEFRAHEFPRHVLPLTHAFVTTLLACTGHAAQLRSCHRAI